MGKKSGKNKKHKGSGSNPIHDRITNSLENRLLKDDRLVLKEFKYKYKGDHEADILMINKEKGYAYAVEVKSKDSSKHRKKARWQLNADEEYIKHEFNTYRIYKFYAYSSRNKRGYEIERYESSK